MKNLLVLNLTFTTLGIAYNKSSFDLTVPEIESLHSILLFISSLTLGVLIAQNYRFEKTLSKLGLVVGLVLIFLATSITTFLKDKNYEDIKILKVLKESKHKIIRQYLDEGAFGGHYRTVEVTDILPGLRYINKVVE
ncbi:hypothetical protein GS399_10395 [Pedobacter sp. HMF7647]|uniref:Uncharacterized protein n=1 Tax=Hufsiella arboris TaxID=2695275 RepID=A0A7K1YBA5_9SPHI|nr:hypothetical protein [Hufsiella arboris]MXV51379.1 hypothetical protein [Hufsiella arboris]